MTNEQKVLLALVRAGLQPRVTDGAPERAVTDESAFAGFDSTKFLMLAQQQGLLGVAWTGYQELRPLVPALGHFPASLKLNWYAAVSKIRQHTNNLFAQANLFAEKIFEEAGLPCIVLKGVDYARLYPFPEFREYGDLDCWMGNGAAAQGDEAALRIGAMREDGGYKHSHLYFHNLTIENHYCFTSHEGTRRGLRAEALLHRMMAESAPEPIRESRLLSPPPAFTALFLLRHACGHFLAEGIRLRYVTDWMLFLRRYPEVARREDILQALDELRLMPFAMLLTAYCERYLGLPAGLFPNDVPPKLFAAFCRDLFAAQPDLANRHFMAVGLRILRRFRRMARFHLLLDEAYWLKVRNTFKFSAFLRREDARKA